MIQVLQFGSHYQTSQSLHFVSLILLAQPLKIPIDLLSGHLREPKRQR